MTQSKIPKSKKKNFSRFTYAEAFKQLNLTDLIPWAIASNGAIWEFFKLALTGEAYQTLPYSINNISVVLGHLRYIFQQCESNLSLND